MAPPMAQLRRETRSASAARMNATAVANERESSRSARERLLPRLRGACADFS